jgi:hypothetical protein
LPVSDITNFLVTIGLLSEWRLCLN